MGRSRLLYIEECAESAVRLKALLAGRKDLLLLHAADANLGIKLARSRRPHAILIDIDRAGMSAAEFVKVLRAEPATETTPVLRSPPTPRPRPSSRRWRPASSRSSPSPCRQRRSWKPSRLRWNSPPSSAPNRIR